jgi:uncharacterized membrane protein
MRCRRTALRFMLILGLAFAITGCSRKREPGEVQDLESVRASLREQVARGELSKEEAIVRLAQATKEAKLGSGGKDDAKLSPALKALSEELKERVAKGELTEEEAKAAWMEATENVKVESRAKAPQDSVKEEQ